MQALLWILAALTTAAAFYITFRADRLRAAPYPWLTAALRALAIALVWALLLAPSISIDKQEIRKPVIVFLQDESRSIPPALKGDTIAYRTAANNLLRRLSDKYRVVMRGFGNTVQTDSLFRYRQPATDISAALQNVTEFYGQQNLGAVIIATDGRFNQGIHPLFQSLALHSPLYAVSIGDTALPKDIRIAQVYANRSVTLHSQAEIRADLIATRCDGYNNSVRILENGGDLQSAPIDIHTDRFDRSVSFTVKPETPGLHHYVIEAPVAAGEANTANNRRDVFISVTEEKKTILIAAAAPHPDIAALREALAGTDAYTVTERIGMPEADDHFNVVILHNLPAEAAPKGKPVWMIGGGNSPLHDALPGVATGFTAFTLPVKLTAVTDRLPPLSMAQNVPAIAPGAQPLFVQRGGNIPLWTVQSGAPAMAFLPGEGLWRWRLYEYRYFHNHDVVDECIRQTVALLAATTTDRPFRVELPKYEWSDGENVTLNAYLLNATGRQVNTPDATITITDSSGRDQHFSFERSGDAYRLNAGIMAGGTYSYTARTVYNGKPLTAAGSFVVNSTPLEAMETGADYSLLYSLSKKYGGSVVPSANMASLYDSISRNENVKPLIITKVETAPVIDWKWYFFLLLAVMSAEWLLRKYWLAQ